MNPLDPAKLLDQLLYHEEDPLLFNSAFFLVFFSVVLIVHGLLHKWENARVYVLSFFSVYFFYKTCNWYVLFILLACTIDYVSARVIHTTTDRALKKSLLYLSYFVNLGLLFYFKYTNFFIDLVNRFRTEQFPMVSLILPVGISFYTFENLSYTIDVYQGKVKPVKKWIDYFFFLSFFPKLMMGPIVRAASFIPQIRASAAVSKVMVGEGLYLIASGIFKKMVISDFLNANIVSRVFESPASHPGLECLLALYCYAMVIYCDFSGYSDMAIGMAKWLGFDIGVNFRSPYRSMSIGLFWRRWHISLSDWLRDYVYIPLGGNRLGQWKTYRNLMATMLIGGFWHGASWNFVFWGGLHGAALALQRLREGFGRELLVKLPYSNRATKAFAAILTFHFVCFTWIFFRCGSFKDSAEMITQVFCNFQPGVIGGLYDGYREIIALLALAFLLHFIPPKAEIRFKRFLRYLPFPLQALYLILVIYLAIHFKQAEAIPPIYLQF